MTALVRVASADDLEAVAAIHAEAFRRQRDSRQWVGATLAGAPRLLAYVIEVQGQVYGYAFWAQKSGIRALATLELDQVAVSCACQGKGLGTQLISQSLAQVRGRLEENGQKVHGVLVSTRSDNGAQALYQRLLGVEVVATIEGLYSGTELLMLGRDRP